nr:response regulator [Prolixibacteraceae bacterium]
GLSQLALKTNLNSQQKDYISKVNLSGKSLLGIINDILDFSQIEAGKLVLESVEFDLEKVFQDLENMLAIKAFDKGLEFVIRIAPDVPLSLIGDPLRLGQILINLVNNAIKFTKDGEVIIYAFLKKKTKKNVTLVFRISDTGIGIERSKVEDLFGSFSQADNSTTRQYGGTGLGLAISKKLAKSMHGNIEVQSTPGIGSEFTFNATLGISKKQKRDLFVLPQNIQELNVFVCDNNVTTQAVYKDILVSFRCKVRLFSNGHDLLEAVENGEPCNLAIIDWYMPDMDGVQTAQKIHESSKIKTFPHIIICTKPNNESLIELVNQFGINAFLNKPINCTSLFNIILKIYERTDLVIPSTTIDNLSDEAQIAQINGASILLVEDNEVNQQVAKEILESVGCRVEIAVNGLEAVQALLNFPLKYELVLMDIQRPVMDGFLASVRIRENPALKSIPIVAITADAIVGIKEKCIQVGMNDIITKPFEPDQIYTILLKYIQIKERKKVDVVPRVNNNDELQLPVFNYIDTNEGLRRVNKNRELYVKLIRNFYKNYNGIINQVIEAYISENQLLAKRLIHTLKGISGNLGAKAIYAICLELELSEGLNKEDLVSVLEPLRNELTHVFNEIAPYNQLMEKMEIEEPLTNFVQVNEHELIKILLILKNQLERSDADSIDTIKNLLNQTGVGNHRNIILKIETELNQYNFDAALKLVDSFIETLNNG